MLKRITISHYKSISFADVYLSNINICVGNNASGKSNFLDAIGFLSDIASADLDFAIATRHGIKSVSEWAPRRRADVSIGIEFELGSLRGTYTITIRPSTDRFFVRSESGSVSYFESRKRPRPAPSLLSGVLLEGESENKRTELSFTRTADGKIAVTGGSAPSVEWMERMHFLETDTVLHALSSRNLFGRLGQIAAFLENIRLYKIYPNTLRTPEVPTSEAVLKEHGENTASVYKRMTSRDNNKNREARREIVESLKLAVPELTGIQTRNIAGYVAPTFQMKEASGQTHFYNASQMSDGTLRLFGLLVALYQTSSPRLLCLEEPEQNINPGMLDIIAESVEDISERTQVIISTHSPYLLDRFDPDDLIVFDKQDGKTQIGKIDRRQKEIVKRGLKTLGQISMSDMIRKDG